MAAAGAAVPVALIIADPEEAMVMPPAIEEAIVEDAAAAATVEGGPDATAPLPDRTTEAGWATASLNILAFAVKAVKLQHNRAR